MHKYIICCPFAKFHVGSEISTKILRFCLVYQKHFPFFFQPTFGMHLFFSHNILSVTASVSPLDIFSPNFVSISSDVKPNWITAFSNYF